MAFSPDGNTIASGSGDATIKLWNAKTGKSIKTLTGHAGFVLSVAFSPDGNTLASASYDSTIKLWNAKTGKLIKTLTGHTLGGHTFPVWSVAFSPDGNTLASGGGIIRLWNAKTGKLIKTLTEHASFAFSVAFSPDGNTLACGSGGSDAPICLWNAKTGELRKTLIGHTAIVFSVAFSPDGNTLASGSEDDTIKLWNAKTGELRKTLIGHTHDVRSVAFSPDGNTLASGSEDDTIRLWHVQGGATPNLPTTTVSLSKSDIKVAPGKAFKISATLENTEEVSAATTLQFYGPVEVVRTTVQATSGTLPTIDFTGKTLGEPINIAAMEADSTLKKTITATASETAGTYAYKACIQRTNGAGGTDEICSDVITVTVAPPDLHVSVWAEAKVDEVWTKTTTVAPGKEFKLAATVSNAGGKSDKTALWFYLQDEDTKSAKELGGSQIYPLPTADGKTEVTKSITVTAPETPGHYIYSASVDDVDDEKKSINNYNEVTITVGRPDLVVESFWADAPYVDIKSRSFNLHVTVKNNGNVTSEETTLRYYRSANEVVSKSDIELEDRDMPKLEPGKTATLSLETQAPYSVGNHYYRAYVESVPNETKTGNNWSDVLEFTVVGGHALTLPQDLITDVAFGENSTHFVLNPQFAIFGTEEQKENIKHTNFQHRCTITLQIPGTKVYGAKTTLQELAEDIPEEFPYFMFPLETPKEKMAAVAEGVRKAKSEQKQQEIEAAISVFEAGWGLITSAIGLIPGACEIKSATMTAISSILLLKSVVQAAKNVYKASIDSGLSDELKSIVDEYLQTLTNPKVDIRNYSGLFGNDFIEVPTTHRILFMIPKKLSGIDIEVKQQVHFKAGFDEIEEEGISNDSQKLANKILEHIGVLNAKDDVNFSIEEPDKSSFLEPYLAFLIEEGINIDKLYYVGGPHIITHHNHWNLEETWQQENGAPTAPRARPMSLADYPPFQQLPPEVQEYLLQHFEGTATPGTINPEVWQIPETTSLLPNYPNPFNPETWIPYQLAESADVKLTIYDINGRIVRELDFGHQRAGMYHGRSRAAYWDGRNAVGEPVASGVYFYTLTAGKFTATRRMLIRK